HEISGGGHRAANVRRASPRDAFRLELFERPERNTPRDVSGRRVHRNQLAPWRLRARIPRIGLPEPPAFRRHLPIGGLRTGTVRFRCCSPSAVTVAAGAVASATATPSRR